MQITVPGLLISVQPYLAVNSKLTIKLSLFNNISLL